MIPEQQGKSILKYKNENWNKSLFIWGRGYITLKKEGKNSTIETKFDKFVNKVSMLETSNKVDKEKVAKENNISLSRYPTASLPSDIV